MNDELSDYFKKMFMLPLTIELQDHKEKVFYNAPVSLTVRICVATQFQSGDFGGNAHRGTR